MVRLHFAMVIVKIAGVMTMPNTREKLIEVLKECFDNGLNFEESADHLIANGVRLEEKQATSDQTSNWIPVTERLPEGECLAVSMITGPAYGEMLIGYVAEVSILDTGYECEGDGVILPNVTHWMPLPTPPKGA